MLLPLLLNNLLSGATGTVPDVVGSSEAQADIDIVAAGFVTGVSTDYSDSVASGLVISQSPAAGATATLGSTVSITVSLGVRTTPTAAGISRRRQRTYVEIDGQKFVVSSQDEAMQLLQQARALAERQAETRAAVAEKNVTRIARRTGSVPQLKVVAPEIKVSADLDVGPIIKDIQRLYERAAADAELRILLQKQMDEEDEELLLL